MKAVGIIAEYNPFHRGHQYHIQKSREITGADAVIVIMSGNFVQRGEPAIIDKYSRAAMALTGGADLVLELPVTYATGTAERFAAGAVNALHALPVVKDLVCGSESPDSSLWNTLTSLLNHPTPEYESILHSHQKSGLSYPAARARACERLIPGSGCLLEQPNNILALEYRRAIARIPNCHIHAHEIQRVGKGYHDTEWSGLGMDSISLGRDSCDLDMNSCNLGMNSCNLGMNSCDLGMNSCDLSMNSCDLGTTDYQHRKASFDFPSASGIRQALFDHSAWTSACHSDESSLTDSITIQLKNGVPSEVLPYMTYAVHPDSLSSMLRYTLRNEDEFTLTAYQDMNSDLAHRLLSIYREHPEYRFTEFADALKNRSITRTRANRALLHTILQLRASDHGSTGSSDSALFQGPQALRILGLRKGSPILREVMDHAQIPLVTKMADAPRNLFDDDIRASHLYNQLVFEGTGRILKDEYRQGPVIL